MSHGVRMRVMMICLKVSTRWAKFFWQLNVGDASRKIDVQANKHAFIRFRTHIMLIISYSHDAAGNVMNLARDNFLISLMRKDEEIKARNVNIFNLTKAFSFAKTWGKWEGSFVSLSSFTFLICIMNSIVHDARSTFEKCCVYVHKFYVYFYYFSSNSSFHSLRKLHTLLIIISMCKH